MNGNSKVISFPGSTEHSVETREARVCALKTLIANGEYHPDARAVAEAMLADGVFAVRSSRLDAAEVSEPAGMRRAMEHFVVPPETPAASPKVRRATGS